MKKVHFMRVLTGAAIVSALLTAGVSAAEIPAEEPAVIAVEEAVMESKYVLSAGKVVSISEARENGYRTVTLDNEQGGIVLHVPASAFVLSSNTGAYGSLEDLAEGDEVMAILDALAPTTLSLPPQTSGVAGLVKMDGGNVDLSIYDEELVNRENSLKLNVGEKTVITDIRGSRMLFTAEDLKNSELLVLYGASTRSIPAQTTPTAVVIMNNEAMAQEEASDVAMEGLRAVAEENGYKVTWTANDAPILLEKEGVSMSVQIGSNLLMVNGEEIELSGETVLEGDVTMVSTEIEAFLL